MEKENLINEISNVKSLLKKNNNPEHSSNQLKVLESLKTYIDTNNSFPDTLIIDSFFYNDFKSFGYVDFFNTIPYFNIIIVERQGKTIFELKALK